MIDNHNGGILEDGASPAGGMRNSTVDVGTGFTFHQAGNTPEIPDAFIDQHHHRADQGAHGHVVLSATEAHELLNHHGYSVGHVTHGYEPHLYDVSGGLLSEADLEGHVFHQLGEQITLPSASHVKEGELMHAKRRKYYDQNHQDGDVSRGQNEFELVDTNTVTVVTQNIETDTHAHVGKERGGYTWWWKPGLIEPILDAVRKQQSYFKAVNHLKESEFNQDGRYNKLAPSTVESWFVRGSFVTLKNQYLHHRHRLERASRPGQKSILSKYPELFDAIKNIVRAEIDQVASDMSYHFDMKFVQQEMRRLVYQYGHQEILKENGGKLTLSPKFVRRFVSKHFSDMPDPFPKRGKRKERTTTAVDDPPLVHLHPDELSSELHDSLEPLLTHN